MKNPLKPLPGQIGPLKTAKAKVGAAFWATNRRRSVTVVVALVAFVAWFLLWTHGSITRLTQYVILLSTFFVIVLKPHLGVFALMVYRYFSGGLNIESLVGALGITVVKSLGVFTLLGFIGVIAVKKIRPLFGNRTQILFLYGFFAAVLISAFAAFTWRAVWVQLFQTIQNIILYIIFFNLFADAKWLSRYVWVTLAAVVAACLTGILSVALSDVVRAAGSLGNANGLAMVANQGVAGFLVLSLAAAAVKKKMLLFVGLGVCLITIIFTGSRGGLLTAIVIFAHQLFKRRRGLAPYAAGLIVIVLAFAFIPEQYKTRQEAWFGALFGGRVGQVTGGSRGFIYRSAWQIYKTSPIIGVGPRTFGRIYAEEFAPGKRGAVASARAVHSGLLEVLVMNGILGFALFAGLIIITFYIFRANGRLCRRANLATYALLNDVFEAMYLATIVAGTFETILRVNWFFILAAAAAAIDRAARVHVRAAANDALPADARLAPGY